MGKVFPFIAGAAVGALAALAFAPQAGDQTRALIAEKANSIVGEAKDFGAGMPASAQDMYKAVCEKGAGLLKDAPAKAKDVAGGTTAAVDNDELREKIEAARRRIAAQVMENAEQNDAVDVAADANANAGADAAAAE